MLRFCYYSPLKTPALSPMFLTTGLILVNKVIALHLKKERHIIKNSFIQTAALPFDLISLISIIFQASKLKEQGNQHLQNGDYDKAISSYSEAIELCPKNHVLFSNRSAAFAKKGLYKESLVDAQRIVDLNPSWGKVRPFCNPHSCATLKNDLEDAG